VFDHKQAIDDGPVYPSTYFLPNKESVLLLEAWLTMLYSNCMHFWRTTVLSRRLTYWVMFGQRNPAKTACLLENNESHGSGEFFFFPSNRAGCLSHVIGHNRWLNRWDFTSPEPMTTQTTVNLWTVYVHLQRTFWNHECGGGTRFFLILILIFKIINYKICDVAEMAIIHRMI